MKKVKFVYNYDQTPFLIVNKIYEVVEYINPMSGSYNEEIIIYNEQNRLSKFLLRTRDTVFFLNADMEYRNLIIDEILS